MCSETSEDMHEAQPYEEDAPVDTLKKVQLGLGKNIEKPKYLTEPNYFGFAAASSRTTSNSRRQSAAVGDQQLPVPSTSSSSRQSRRPAVRTTVATASRQPQSTNRAQVAAAAADTPAGDNHQLSDIFFL
ncbi:hypothetical protein KY285_008575 [Solanum tuberosum]|nr:hypothetical protein KY285_008575 [Solanum tuberosum]